MKYTTTLTSKGTITIASPLRKSLGLKTGQKLNISLNKDNQLIVDAGVSMQTFVDIRERITSKIPNHLKGLQGEALKQAKINAWTEAYDNRP